MDTALIEIDKKVEIPSGVELLKEKIANNFTYSLLAEKYNTSVQNIHQKIQHVIKVYDAHRHEQYIKDPSTFLKVVEAYHVTESVNPDKNKNMSAYQHAGMANLINGMRTNIENNNPPDNKGKIEETPGMIVAIEQVIINQIVIESKDDTVKEVDSNTIESVKQIEE